MRTLSHLFPLWLDILCVCVVKSESSIYKAAEIVLFTYIENDMKT